MSIWDGKSGAYLRLARFHKPIGIALLLWPTWWALWLAAGGFPSWKNLVIFTLGVIFMRAAGCVINDYADRNVDGAVARTQDRPLATGELKPRQAINFFLVLLTAAFLLVLATNQLTIALSLGGALLAIAYPFMKRHTYLPQVVLGAAFGWAIPMAYAAEFGAVPPLAWLLFVSTVLWATAYDTIYAMVDRPDDIEIGVKSTAILFGDLDRVMIGIIQAMTVFCWYLVGRQAELSAPYWIALAVAVLLFVYQQWLIRHRDPQRCFRAFLNNNWVGASVFAGMLLAMLYPEVTIMP